MNGLRNFWRAARLGWVGLVVGIGLTWIWRGGSELLKQQAGVLAWKCVVVGTGVTLAHLFRKQLFAYIDLSEVAKQDDSRSGMIFLGMAVFYAAIILGLCTGL